LTKKNRQQKKKSRSDGREGEPKPAAEKTNSKKKSPSITARNLWEKNAIVPGRWGGENFAGIRGDRRSGLGKKKKKTIE